MLGIAGAEQMFFSASPAKTGCSGGCWSGASIFGEIFHLVSGHCWFYLLLVLLVLLVLLALQRARARSLTIHRWK